MEIKQPTIEELEAWWEENVEEWARTKQPDECVIALPMIAMNGVEVMVEPKGPFSAPEHRAQVRVYEDGHTYYSNSPISAPLDPVLNELALAFDQLEGNPDDQADDVIADGDERRDIPGRDCLAFIRSFRQSRSAPLGGVETTNTPSDATSK